MSECTHDCSNCSANCDSRQPSREDFIEKLNDMSRVGKVIGIVSGKGGVGKSLVTSLLAVTFNRRGLNTAILDADVTGPSIPKAFGVKEKAKGMEEYIIPAVTKTGIQMMSVNLLLDNETDPVVWRGPVIAGAVKQFWTDVIWKDVDYMFVDMPPGTGDVPLTVFQSIPLDGIVIVTSPQELVSMIVTKAVNMAKLMERRQGPDRHAGGRLPAGSRLWRRSAPPSPSPDDAGADRRHRGGIRSEGAGQTSH